MPKRIQSHGPRAQFGKPRAAVCSGVDVSSGGIQSWTVPTFYTTQPCVCVCVCVIIRWHHFRQGLPALVHLMSGRDNPLRLRALSCNPHFEETPASPLKHTPTWSASANTQTHTHTLPHTHTYTHSSPHQLLIRDIAAR